MRIGKITENALKRSVLKQIKTEFKDIKSAAAGSDCAFSSEGRCFSAVSPVAAEISESGYYAVYKAVNSLTAQGIRPDHFVLSVLLPADTEEPQLKVIIKDAVAAGRELSVPYAGGHTEVTTAVVRPVITACAVGYGEDGSGTGDTKSGRQQAAEGICFAKPRAGQDLVVTKWIALEGTAVLAKEKRQKLLDRYPAPFIDVAADFKSFLDIRKEAGIVADFYKDSAQAAGGGVSIHDVSSGGIFAALWEMAERAGCGLEAYLKAIPIRQETIEVCEQLEVNPYLLTSAGALLIACDDGEGLVNRLAESGINASVIGCLREGNDRIIRNDDEIRYLDMPQTDELVRVFS